MSSRLGCGSHDLDKNGNPFDYTCDDCMIPDSLDPPELNDTIDSDSAYGKIDSDDRPISPPDTTARPF